MHPIKCNSLFDKNKYIQILDIDGHLTIDKYQPDIEKIANGYKIMKLSRLYEEKAIKWQRQGKMLTFPPAMGQEAIQVAIGMCIEPKIDWFVSGYRDNATWLYLNKPLKDIILYWCGNEKGSSWDKTNKVTPVDVLIGTQFSHATGIALSNKILQKDGVVFSVIGDGGTSSGEFYSALNFAATLNVRAIFIIQNNQWAISTPLNCQTASTTLGQKAVAAGLDFYRVDGNDLLSCYEVVKNAKEYVIKNNRPIVIEALTYRLGPHTTADDPTVYRNQEYHETESQKDPLIRLKKYLISINAWDEEQESILNQEYDNFIDEQFKLAQEENQTSLTDIFEYTYQNLDPDLQKQYQELEAFYNEHNKS